MSNIRIAATTQEIKILLDILVEQQLYARAAELLRAMYVIQENNEFIDTLLHQR